MGIFTLAWESRGPPGVHTESGEREVQLEILQATYWPEMSSVTGQLVGVGSNPPALHGYQMGGALPFRAWKN